MSELGKKNSKAELRRRRREKNRKTLIDPEIMFTSEFETGNGVDFKKYDEDIFGFYPERDPGELYSGQAYYFKFSVENRLMRKQDTKNITVTAIADYDDIWRGWTSLLRSRLWKYLPDGRIEQLDQRFVKATPKSIGINLKLQPQEKFTISNMISIPYTEMKAILEDIQVAWPTFTKLEEIGESIERNKIFSLKINPTEEHWNDDQKQHIIISGTPQTNEFGDYAAINLLRRFLNQKPEYWDKFHNHFKLEFLFFQNPDGIIQGRNMTNSKGENIFFGFDIDDHKSIKKDCPLECQSIWNYLIQNPPDFYLEYHSFFQYTKTIRPYIYPIELLKSKEKRDTYKLITKSLINYSNGAKEKISLDQSWFSNSLAYKLQEYFNTMSIQFKLHSSMKMQENWKIAWDIFEKINKIVIKQRKKQERRNRKS